jgi:hypothetical protein
MNLQEFLNPSEQILAQTVIDYDKKAQITFGVSDKRCFLFEDTKREQSFISGFEFEYVKVQRPKINKIIILMGLIIIIAGAYAFPPTALIGVVLIFIAWWTTKTMLVTTEVGMIQLQFIIKKYDQIQQMAQFMQFVHSQGSNLPKTPLQITQSPAMSGSATYTPSAAPARPLPPSQTQVTFGMEASPSSSFYQPMASQPPLNQPTKHVKEKIKIESTDTYMNQFEDGFFSGDGWGDEPAPSGNTYMTPPAAAPAAQATQTTPAAPRAKFCGHCGLPQEPGWDHCHYCGK